MLMVETDIKGGICHAIHRYVKANNKCMKYYDVNNSYGQAMSQELRKNCYMRVMNKSRFNEGFIKEPQYRH